MKNGKVLKEGTPDVIFNNDELIEKANLKKPLILEIYNELKNNGILPENHRPPRTKNELKQLINNHNIIKNLP